MIIYSFLRLIHSPFQSKNIIFLFFYLLFFLKNYLTFHWLLCFPFSHTLSSEVSFKSLQLVPFYGSFHIHRFSFSSPATVSIETHFMYNLWSNIFYCHISSSPSSNSNARNLTFFDSFYISRKSFIFRLEHNSPLPLQGKGVGGVWVLSLLVS